MTYEDDDLDRQLVLLAHDEGAPSEIIRARTLESSLAALEQAASQGESRSALSGPQQPVVRLVPEVLSDPASEVPRETDQAYGSPGPRRARTGFITMTRKRSTRYGAVAAAAIVILGGFAVWPSGPGLDGDNGQWWLGAPSVWAGEIDQVLDEFKSKGVTCRERTLIVDADGSSRESSTVETFYISKDGYRRDIYDGEFFREIQWYTPDGENMIQTSVRFDTSSYTVLRHGGSFGKRDPVERLRFYVRLLHKADRRLATEMLDGRECVGFEIRASQYGNNPDTWIDRIWFDVSTKLPVRVEESGRPVTGDDARTFTTIRDQFNYNPVLPADTFTPQIPTGFINAHPDELRGDGATPPTSEP